VDALLDVVPFNVRTSPSVMRDGISLFKVMLSKLVFGKNVSSFFCGQLSAAIIFAFRSDDGVSVTEGPLAGRMLTFITPGIMPR